MRIVVGGWTTGKAGDEKERSQRVGFKGKRETRDPRTHTERDRRFFLPSRDIRHFGRAPRRGKATSADSRVITSDIGRKAARIRSDEHRNLAQWALGPAPH